MLTGRININTNKYLVKTVLILEKIKLLTPKRLSLIRYFLKFGRPASMNSPRNLNEIIMQTSFNTDTTLWTELSDKFKVRNYIEECGLGNLLTKLYGVYSSAEEIDFDALPDSFVLKTNNGCGTVIVVEDKSKLNIKQTRKTLNHWLKIPFGVTSAEPHYRKIKPCLIAEEYLKDAHPNPISTSLIDYKFWCFNGHPYFVIMCINRDIRRHTVDFILYETENWKNRQDFMSKKFRKDIEMPKPENLDSMIESAKILAAGFPQVRVDFYEVNGKVYFGELTFTSYGGRMSYLNEQCLQTMADRIKTTAL